jgi:transcriptional regulator with XRE-family HTH domain
MLQWSVRDLAKAAGIQFNIVTDFETGRFSASLESIEAMQVALEKAGVEFTNDKRPGVRLRRP